MDFISIGLSILRVKEIFALLIYSFFLNVENSIVMRKRNYKLLSSVPAASLQISRMACYLNLTRINLGRYN